MPLSKELADAVRDKTRVVNANTLRSAIFAVVQKARKAAADEVDHPDDPSLGWFADGMETTVELIWDVIGDGAEVRGRGARQTGGADAHTVDS
jgi:hypothetical protein